MSSLPLLSIFWYGGEAVKTMLQYDTERAGCHFHTELLAASEWHVRDQATHTTYFNFHTLKTTTLMSILYSCALVWKIINHWKTADRKLFWLWVFDWCVSESDCRGVWRGVTSLKKVNMTSQSLLCKKSVVMKFFKMATARSSHRGTLIAFTFITIISCSISPGKNQMNLTIFIILIKKYRLSIYAFWLSSRTPPPQEF